MSLSVVYDNMAQRLSPRIATMIELILVNREMIDRLEVGSLELCFGTGKEVKPFFNRLPARRLEKRGYSILSS